MKPDPAEPTDAEFQIVDDGTGKPAPWFGGWKRLAWFLVVLGLGTAAIEWQNGRLPFQ